MSEVPQPSKTRLQERQEAIEASRAFYTPAAEIQGIVNEMRVNFQTHVTKEYGFRQAQLHGLKQLITERQSEIYDALYKDIHKNETGAYITEIGLVLSEINYAIKNLSSWMVPRKVSNSWVNIPVLTSTKLFPEPLGVTLIISPWNYPILLTLNPLIGAIAAGCSAVIKPSSVTCNVTHLLAQLFPNYLDPKFYRVIEGSHDVSDALLAQKWDKIFFTGSGSIGKEVLRAAAVHLTPVNLELGGKSPVIVDDTADLELAARRLVMGKFINSGQTCIAPDYVLADEKIVGELIAQMKKYIVQFFGEDPQKSEDLSRIAAKRQFDRLIKVLNDGLEKGNEGEDEQKLIESYSGKGHILLWGGKSDEGDLYIEPTLLLAKIDSESQVMKEEIFGPLFPIIPVKSEGFIDTAISFINQRDKPLAMYGFTDNKKTKEKITNLTSSGSLSFNECLLQLANKELPFGGVGESGMGFYHGIFSFEAFSHLKSYMDKTKSFDIGTRYPPYNPSKLKLMKTIM